MITRAETQEGRRITTSTRLTKSERAVVDAAARLEGVRVSELLRELVVPAARQRLAELAGAANPR